MAYCLVQPLRTPPGLGIRTQLSSAVPTPWKPSKALEDTVSNESIWTKTIIRGWGSLWLGIIGQVGSLSAQRMWHEQLQTTENIKQHFKLKWPNQGKTFPGQNKYPELPNGLLLQTIPCLTRPFIIELQWSHLVGTSNERTTNSCLLPEDLFWGAVISLCCCFCCSMFVWSLWWTVSKGWYIKWS